MEHIVAKVLLNVCSGREHIEKKMYIIKGTKRKIINKKFTKLEKEKKITNNKIVPNTCITVLLFLKFHKFKNTMPF